MTTFRHSQYATVRVGSGHKWHVKYNDYWTLCRKPPGEEVADFDVDWDDMCSVCLDVLYKQAEAARPQE